MNRSAYVLRRIAGAIPVLFGLSVLIFAIVRIIPGDPVSAALGPSATQEQVEEFRRELGFDEPIPVQYVEWLSGVFQGNWGISLRTRNDVLADISVRIAATLELVIVAVILALLIGIPLGVVAGVYKDKWPDHVSRVFAFLGVSMPRFWIAILLQILFVASLGILPLTGRISTTPPPSVTGFYLIDSLVAGQIDTFFNAASHIILPATALGLSSMARYARYIRSDFAEEKNKDHVMAAQAYGLPQNLIEYKYILKNSFSSAVTIIGLDFGFLVGNAFLVEIVFDWPGMARYGVEALLFSDTNAIIGVTIVVGIIYIGANLIVDLLYGFLDPRITMEDT